VILSKRLSSLSLPCNLPSIPALKLIRGRMVCFMALDHHELGMKTGERGRVKLLRPPSWFCALRGLADDHRHELGGSSFRFHMTDSNRASGIGPPKGTRLSGQVF
jgi:hypothetical protein